MSHELETFLSFCPDHSKLFFNCSVNLFFKGHAAFSTFMSMAPLGSALWDQSSPHKLLLYFLLATLARDVREMRGTTYSWEESEGLTLDLPSVESHQSHSVETELLYTELFKSTGASRMVVRKEQGPHLGQPTSNWEGHLSDCHCHITLISNSEITGIMNKVWFPWHLTYS